MSERNKKLDSFIKNLLRRGSYKWPGRGEAMKKARVARGLYKCASCEGEQFGPRDIQMDHIEPVVDPHKGFTGWDDYINRMFVGEEGYQCVCKGCHAVKTAFENLIRKDIKLEKVMEEDDGI